MPCLQTSETQAPLQGTKAPLPHPTSTILQGKLLDLGETPQARALVRGRTKHMELSGVILSKPPSAAVACGWVAGMVGGTGAQQIQVYPRTVLTGSRDLSGMQNWYMVAKSLGMDAQQGTVPWYLRGLVPGHSPVNPQIRRCSRGCFIVWKPHNHLGVVCRTA